ncbi:MAG: phosphatidylglycerol lysyltransferase domain-containing protein [Angelakisella sp.]
MHGKRNFCNRFEAAPPRLEVRAHHCRKHGRMCCNSTGSGRPPMRESDEGLHKEGCVVRCALRELDELEMTGGVLTAGGKIYGFAVASMINETMMDENIEKADGEEPGAYPMVCREMAKMMKQKYPGLVFINREEDTGDEGLRRSKESYCPVMLLEKYVTREAK